MSTDPVAPVWLLRWHEQGGSVLLHLGLVLLMSSAGWLAASRVSRPWCTALRCVSLFCAVEAAALLCVSLGAGLGSRAVLIFGQSLIVPAYAVLWRAGCLIVGRRSPVRELWWVAIAGGMLTLGGGLLLGSVPYTRGASWLCNAYVALRGTWQMGQHSRSSGQARTGLFIIVLGQLTGWPMLIGGLIVLCDPAVWLTPPPGLGEAAGIVQVGYVTTLTSMGLNIVVAYQVFGRTLHMLTRLRASDLDAQVQGRPVIERALAARLRQRDGSRVAVAALALAEDGPRVRGWGSSLRLAVRAELLLLLRLHQRPGDLLGREDDGTFWLVMPEDSEAQAAWRLQRLQALVATDASLPPDGGPPLRLATALAWTDGREPVGDCLDRLRQACRAAAAGA